MIGKIWLIGGTSESALIANLLISEQLPCLLTVTTVTAQSLYPQSSYLQILVGIMPDQEIFEFCQNHQIKAVIDATHPYATAISQSAIAITHQLAIPYLRYERPELSEDKLSPNTIILDNFESLLQGNYLLKNRTLLTIGYKQLPLFQSWQHRATLFTRLLPSLKSLEIGLNSGFTPDRIIAIRPPITPELEIALYRQWQISLVVTKASGKAGGEDIKRSVTNQLGIDLIIIKRPKIIYPQLTSNLYDVMTFSRLAFL